MSAGSTPTGFDISDLFTRIIPGGILTISVILPVIGPEYATSFPIQNISILIFALVAFLVGEVINTTRISLFDVPNHFRRVLYTENMDSEKYLNKVDAYFSKNHPEWVEGYSLFEMSDKRISQTLHERFDLSSDFDGAHNYYMLLTSDLSSMKSLETKRLENIYIFYKNLRFAIFVSILFQMLFLLASIFTDINTIGTRTAVAFIVGYILLILLYSIVLFLGFISPIDRVYVESLLSDYFAYIKQND